MRAKANQTAACIIFHPQIAELHNFLVSAEFNAEVAWRCSQTMYGQLVASKHNMIVKSESLVLRVLQVQEC